MSINKINLDLAERQYDIFVGGGVLSSAAEKILPLLKRKRIAIIADENAYKFHGDSLISSLESHGVETKIIITKSGEATKSFSSFEHVIEVLLEFGIERSDIIIAFGGGVVGDLTGFVAGVINRGVDFVQIPTTLLSQVDSSVGGKTAINARAGKNLVGIFWQPKLVLADTNVLDTLDKRDIMAGFAEIFKIGLILYPQFFDYVEENATKILGENGPERQYAIEKSIEAKAKVVAEDEREAGVRALLNLGHTFGHAIEAAVEYDETIWRHGEAVACGIAMAARYSKRIGALAPEKCDQIEKFIRDCGYQYKLSPRTGCGDYADEVPQQVRHDTAGISIFNPQAMLKVMSHDKKNSGGKINLVLLKDIGNAYVHKNADVADLLEFLKEECS